MVYFCNVLVIVFMNGCIRHTDSDGSEKKPFCLLYLLRLSGRGLVAEGEGEAGQVRM